MTDDDRSDWSPMERVQAGTMGRCPGTRHDYEAKEVSEGIGLFGYLFFTRKKAIIFCKRCGQIAKY